MMPFWSVCRMGCSDCFTYIYKDSLRDENSAIIQFKVLKPVTQTHVAAVFLGVDIALLGV